MSETYLHFLGLCIDKVYGIDNKPQCAVCGYKMPLKHYHCDACESPFGLSKCAAPGCHVIACEACMKRHAPDHLYE